MPDKIMSSQIASFGEVVPLGTYEHVRLTKIEAKEAENEDGTNYVSLSFEIDDKGEAEGLTTFVPLFPKVTKSQKNGRYYSRGIFEAQQMCQAWGVALPDFEVVEYLDKTTVKGARALARLIGESYKKAGAPVLRVRVVPEKVQEKDERTGKWVDKKENGEQVYRNKTVVLGRSKPHASNAPALDAQAARETVTEAADDEAPSSITFV